MQQGCSPLLFLPHPDEKEKFEPTVFRDTIILGLNEAGGDLDAVAKFLDVTGSRLDYRRYADTLFDILIAGSMLGEWIAPNLAGSPTGTQIQVPGLSVNNLSHYTKRSAPLDEVARSCTKVAIVSWSSAPGFSSLLSNGTSWSLRISVHTRAPSMTMSTQARTNRSLLALIMGNDPGNLTKTSWSIREPNTLFLLLYVSVDCSLSCIHLF